MVNTRQSARKVQSEQRNKRFSRDNLSLIPNHDHDTRKKERIQKFSSILGTAHAISKFKLKRSSLASSSNDQEEDSTVDHNEEEMDTTSEENQDNERENGIHSNGEEEDGDEIPFIGEDDMEEDVDGDTIESTGYAILSYPFSMVSNLVSELVERSISFIFQLYDEIINAQMVDNILLIIIVILFSTFIFGIPFDETTNMSFSDSSNTESTIQAIESQKLAFQQAVSEELRAGKAAIESALEDFNQHNLIMKKMFDTHRNLLEENRKLKSEYIQELEIALESFGSAFVQELNSELDKENELEVSRIQSLEQDLEKSIEQGKVLLNQKLEESVQQKIVELEEHVEEQSEVGTLDIDIASVNQRIQEASKLLSEIQGQDLQNRAKQMEELFNETEKKLESIPTNICDTPVHKIDKNVDAEGMVQKFVDRFYADKIGIADYALGAVGAVIEHDSRLTSPSYVRDQETFIQKLREFFHPISRPPEAIIDADTTIGNCWACALPNCTVTVRLVRPIAVGAITVDHIHPSIAHDVSSSPKRIAVFGVENETLKKELLTEVDFVMDGIQPLPEIQTFVTKKTKKYQMIQFQVLSNHGHPDFTCVYRLRVHALKDVENIDQEM